MDIERIAHPKSGAEIEGRILPSGSKLKPTDLYASSTGKWLPNPVGATESIDNGVVWVRPYDKDHEKSVQQQRREHNRLLDSRCLCEAGTLMSRGAGFSLGAPVIFYDNECPLSHERLFLGSLHDLDEVNKRWPYKDEPDEMKYPHFGLPPDDEE
jgi:hypothetical protein